MVPMWTALDPSRSFILMIPLQYRVLIRLFPADASMATAFAYAEIQTRLFSIRSIGDRKKGASSEHYTCIVEIYHWNLEK